MIAPEFLDDDDVADFLADLEESAKPAALIRKVVDQKQLSHCPTEEAHVFATGCAIAMARGNDLGLSEDLAARTRRLKVLPEPAVVESVKSAKEPA